ncbi:geranylgeranyl reductase [Luminiphilus syltensis NOR5-1B]|uniref:Geranylgeranyl diphosphate reductase n=1 Tax=Luminiphilus syltensis NOR5-1B TaxID=565045 RepID=B8KT44_9GAMM|nr:geranylgeranyl diphosphate reductase [Luminiphilus syltensis]EED35163.1 geranylgeranyl reductase [Luminiphilus syltensis NOR5-1B]
MNNSTEQFDVVVIGGGPAGATAANDLACQGKRVLIVERGFRIKPCGGAIPPAAIDAFDIPQSQLVARIKSARMISPKNKRVDMPIADSYVGMVDRKDFDPWLRARAASNGAEVRTGNFSQLKYLDSGEVLLTYRDKSPEQKEVSVLTRAVIGADGAKSKVGKQCVPGADKIKSVFAYHEIVKAPAADSSADYKPTRCDVWYQGRLSPDFYAWVFPHGDHASIGMGSAVKSFSATQSVRQLRADVGLTNAETVRREGAPIPLKPLKKWDDGRAVLLAGDAAGVVAPASGEGIFYAMLGGRLAADAVLQFLAHGDPAALRQARKRFMKEHGRVFWVLGLLQAFWYGSDKRREKFVHMCDDPDVQRLTWQSYTQKKLVRSEPMAHFRVFMKDMAQLLGIARA